MVNITFPWTYWIHRGAGSFVKTEAAQLNKIFMELKDLYCPNKSLPLDATSANPIQPTTSYHPQNSLPLHPIHHLILPYHWTLFKANPIQPITSCPISVRSLLILNIYPCSSSHPLHSLHVSWQKFCVHFSSLLYATCNNHYHCALWTT